MDDGVEGSACGGGGVTATGAGAVEASTSRFGHADRAVAGLLVDAERLAEGLLPRSRGAHRVRPGIDRDRSAERADPDGLVVEGNLLAGHQGALQDDVHE